MQPEQNDRIAKRFDTYCLNLKPLRARRFKLGLIRDGNLASTSYHEPAPLDRTLHII
jgi:hypothetical protein